MRSSPTSRTSRSRDSVRAVSGRSWRSRSDAVRPRGGNVSVLDDVAPPTLLDPPELEQHDRTDPRHEERSHDPVTERLKAQVVDPSDHGAVEMQLPAEDLDVLDGSDG